MLHASVLSGPASTGRGARRRTGVPRLCHTVSTVGGRSATGRGAIPVGTTSSSPRSGSPSRPTSALCSGPATPWAPVWPYRAPPSTARLCAAGTPSAYAPASTGYTGRSAGSSGNAPVAPRSSASSSPRTPSASGTSNRPRRGPSFCWATSTTGYRTTPGRFSTKWSRSRWSWQVPARTSPLRGAWSYIAAGEGSVGDLRRRLPRPRSRPRSGGVPVPGHAPRRRYRETERAPSQIAAGVLGRQQLSDAEPVQVGVFADRRLADRRTWLDRAIWEAAQACAPTAGIPVLPPRCRQLPRRRR